MPGRAEAETMAIKRRPRRVLPFLIAFAAILAAAGVWHSLNQPAATVVAVAAAKTPPARICVTRHGACSIGLVRAGDPCSCWYSIHGNVRGRVELVRSAIDRNQPGQAEDPLESLSPLYGP